MSQPLADDAVIAAARSGDRGALDRLDQAVRPLLEDLAARCTCDPAGAGALVRDISVRVRLYLGQWHPDERFDVFVARLAVPQLGYHEPVDLASAADRSEFSQLPRTVGTPDQLGELPQEVWLAFRSTGRPYVALHLLHRSGLTADEVAVAVGSSPAAWAGELAALQAQRAHIDARFGPIGPAELLATDLFERFTALSTPQPAAVAAASSGRRIPARVAIALAGAAVVLAGTIGGIAAFTGSDEPAATVLGTTVTNSTTSTVASLTRPTLPPVSGGAPSPSPLAAAVGVGGSAGVSTDGTVATATRRPDPAPSGGSPAATEPGAEPPTGTTGGGSTSSTPQVTTSRPGTSTSTTTPGTTTSSTSTTTTPGTTTTTTPGTTTTTTPGTTTTTTPGTTTTTTPGTTTTTTPPTTTTTPPTTTTTPPTTTTTTAGGPGGGQSG